MNNRLQQFLEAVRSSTTKELAIEISEPYAPEGVWFIDFSIDDYTLVVQYSEAFGFGLSAGSIGFSHKPDEQILNWEIAAARAKELIYARGLTIPTATLTDLRAEKSQKAVAQAMDIKQPSYAKMEGTPLANMQLSTLKRILSAMDAKLHLLVESDDGNYFFLKNSDKIKSQIQDSFLDHPPHEGVRLHIMRSAAFTNHAEESRYDLINSCFSNNSKVFYADFKTTKPKINVYSSLHKTDNSVVVLLTKRFDLAKNSEFSKGFAKDPSCNYYKKARDTELQHVSYKTLSSKGIFEKALSEQTWSE